MWFLSIINSGQLASIVMRMQATVAMRQGQSYSLSNLLYSLLMLKFFITFWKQDINIRNGVTNNLGKIDFENKNPILKPVYRTQQYFQKKLLNGHLYHWIQVAILRTDAALAIHKSPKAMEIILDFSNVPVPLRSTCVWRSLDILLISLSLILSAGSGYNIMHLM